MIGKKPGGNMSKIKVGIIISILATFPISAVAQMVPSKVTASNGVVIDVNSDEFAGRYEYTAPVIHFTPSEGTGSGFALVAKIKRAGAYGPLNIQGSIIYSGDWRYYDSAVFKGGDPADYTSTSRDVGSCQYGCTLTEGFNIKISSDKIKKYAEAGIIPIQIRSSKSTSVALIQIPTSYISAVEEVAK